MSIKENSTALHLPLDGSRNSWQFPAMQLYGADQCLDLLGSYSTVFHWRARLLYGKGTHPYMPASRWMGMPYHGWNEADFRVIGTKIYLPAVFR